MTADKAIAALLVAIVGILNTLFGVNLGIPVDVINGIAFVLAPILVWAIPNRLKQ